MSIRTGDLCILNGIVCLDMLPSQLLSRMILPQPFQS